MSNWSVALPKPSEPPSFVQLKQANNRSRVSNWPLCAFLYPQMLRLHQLWPSFPDTPPSSQLELAALLKEAVADDTHEKENRELTGMLYTAIASTKPSMGIYVTRQDSGRLIGYSVTRLLPENCYLERMTQSHSGMFISLALSI